MIPPRGPVSVEIPIDFQYGSTPLPLTPPEASSAGRRTDETATAGDISRVAELVASVSTSRCVGGRRSRDRWRR